MFDQQNNPGCVHALGNQPEEFALKYAHLTGRTYRQSKSYRDIAPSSDDVIFCLSEDLTVDLLNALYGSRGGQGAPGLVCAPTSRDLGSIWKMLASKYHDPPLPNRRRVFVNAHLPFGFETTGTDLIFGGNATRADLLSGLAAQSSVIVLLGKSDGIDLQLSNSQFLCPFITSPTTEYDLPPACLEEQRCTRFPILPPIKQAANDNWIIPVSLLKAQIVILYGCRCLRLRDGIIDPAYGLAQSLLRQGDFGAIITTWRQAGGSPDVVNGLVNDICSGTKVGIAVEKFNSSAVARRFGIKLCVMGDPRFSIAPDQRFPLLPEVGYSSHAESVRHSGTSMGSDILLMKEAVTVATQTGLYDPKKGTSLSAALCLKAPPLQGSEVLSKLDHDLVEFLGSSWDPWLMHFLNPFFELKTIDEQGICPSCHSVSRSVIMVSPNYLTQERIIVRCPLCLESSNLPKGWSVDFDISVINTGNVLLRGVPSSANVLACFTERYGPYRQVVPCQTSKEGSCVVALPINLPHKRYDCDVFIASNLEVGAISFKFRKLGTGAFATALSSAREHRSVT